MGTDKDGDESCNGMISGGNALLRRFGICTGKNTGINQTGSLLSGIKNKPGYGQIKRADTPKMKSTSRSLTEKDSTLQSPRRMRAKYTHRTNFVYALCISP